MTPSPTIDPNYASLRKIAEELAQSRKERVTTAHLLAVVAGRVDEVSELLAGRRLTRDQVLRSVRATTDDADDAIDQAVKLARDVAQRSGVQPAPAHLLVALLSERTFAAHRVVDQCGVDTARLRTAALQLGIAVGARRTTRREAPEARALPAARGQTIPLFPPAARAPQRAPAATLPTARSVLPPVVAPPAVAPPVAPSANSAALVPPGVVPRAPARPAPAERAPAAAGVPAERSTSRRAERRRRPRPTPAADAATRFELDPRRFPLLTSLGQNLTLAAARGEVDPAVGREREVEQALDVLAKRQGNNPCLVGLAGVGKTSVVRGLALRIAEAKDVQSLDDRIIVEIPAGELIAGTGVRGALATRLAALRKEVLASSGRVVLFFDEIHQLFAGEGTEEIAAELKVALARGELPCIGATTLDEYKKVIEPDQALARRFTLVEVDEPSREDAFLILSALSERFGAHHHVQYDDQALALSIAWSVRYLPGRALPDKAVSIVDLAGARARRRGHTNVDAEAVAEVVAELADMPVERLLATDGERMLKLEGLLAERVVGHREPIAKIARILRRNAAGLGSRRPIGTFLLLGPTGVGKTETAKAVAEVLFHDERAMTRLDLSEYGEAHSVARLIGAPPGYVGHEAGGQLTEAVRRRPYQVVLLDEIEKAHPDVLVAFLGLFDEGRLTDGRGRLVDFTNTVVLMTSNLGAAEAGSTSKRRVGFGADAGPMRDELERSVAGAARAALPPELYNRIDEVLVFSPLARDEVREVARRSLDAIARALEAQRGVRLEADPRAIEHLLDAGGYDPALGARPMRRTIARLVEAPLAELLLAGRLARGDVAWVTFTDAGGLRVDALSGVPGEAAE